MTHRDPIDEALTRARRHAHVIPAPLEYDHTALLRRWTWKVVDETTGEVLATGRAMTRRVATRRKYRAYVRELNR